MLIDLLMKPFETLAPASAPGAAIGNRLLMRLFSLADIARDGTAGAYGVVITYIGDLKLITSHRAIDITSYPRSFSLSAPTARPWTSPQVCLRLGAEPRSASYGWSPPERMVASRTLPDC